MRHACSCIVLLPLAAAQRYTASDKLFITDAVQPPRVLAFDVRSKRMRTQVQYTVASLLGPEGLRDPLTADGRNRTLRPHGIVLREGDIADTIYWADAGASAILALRIDGSPARVVAGGALDDVVLDQPEQVAFVREPNGGLTLYWADLGFNKIARCALQETDEKPGRCGPPEDVVLATPMVTGLVADEASDPRMIYWTDGVDQVIRGAPMDSATPASRAAAAVDVRAWAPMPSCLTLIGEATDGDFEGEPPTLYWADQASPPSIRRRFLNGSDVEQVLFDSYLAKPAALVLSRAIVRLAHHRRRGEARPPPRPPRAARERRRLDDRHLPRRRPRAARARDARRHRPEDVRHAARGRREPAGERRRVQRGDGGGRGARSGKEETVVANERC